MPQAALGKPSTIGHEAQLTQFLSVWKMVPEEQAQGDHAEWAYFAMGQCYAHWHVTVRGGDG